MIIYDLVCPLGHQFEGWFQSAKAFEEQAKQHLVECVHCGATDIQRVPSGGHNAGSRRDTAASVPAKAQAGAQGSEMASEQGFAVDPIMVAKALNHFVEKNFEDVGSAFADRAVKMHKGEEEPKAIRGQADQNGVEKMQNEGVEFAFLPKLGPKWEQ
ncbi:MAG: DUF1178 family protein [Deltaproteobacteria bacterium]|nr:DUF1178 family protein [Deltaproteobacteria bacterium]